jgi:DNA-binding response OmpR family regulator
MNIKTLSLLIVSDNALFADALIAQMPQGAGFDAKSVALQDLAASEADVLFGLDLVLVIGQNAAEIEKLLRSKFYRGPVLALVSEADRAAEQDAILLPVRYPALLQKIRSLAGSFWFRDDLTIEMGPFMLRPAFKELIRGTEAAIALTDKEVEILIYLYRAGRKIVPRDVLLAEIWGYNAEVSTHTLETHIYRLRQKIETTPDIAELLVTEAGGYRLATAVGA